MVLLADSGATKTTWRLLNSENTSGDCTTGGINPFQIGYDEIVHLLETEFSLSPKGISTIWFYGAGCAYADKNKTVADALFHYFGTKEIHVNSDLFAAARSLCGKKPGIACILGTGSNSCYYDGKEIAMNIPALGYVLDDEGSGNAIGRKLISDLFKNILPQEIKNKFLEKYDVTLGDILNNVYRKTFPNRYLAQFARFVCENINYPQLQELVNCCFRKFFERNVMQYPDTKDLPVHFTGSIAYYFSQQLKQTAAEFGLTVGNITQEPMEGLVEYHSKL